MTDAAALIHALNDSPRLSYAGEKMTAEWHARQFERIGMSPTDGFAAAAQLLETLAPVMEHPERLARVVMAEAAARVCLATGACNGEWGPHFAIVGLLASGYAEERLLTYVRFIREELESLDAADAARVMLPERLFSSRIFGAGICLLRALGSDTEEAARLTFRTEVEHLLGERRAMVREKDIVRAREERELDRARKSRDGRGDLKPVFSS